MVKLALRTSDEANAETTCETCLQNALSIDPDNADALQCLANLRILRERDVEASELLDKVLAQVLSESMERNLTRIGEDKVFNADFCKQTGRLLMELSRYSDSASVLEKVVNSSEENVEAWYLLAYAYYSNGKYNAASDCVKVLSQLFEKKELQDKEIQEATAELDQKLKELEGKKEDMMDQEEDEYEDEEEMSDK
eukprot:TRINITY_DN1070_c0_g1_i4.p5 TRINITY_DN1070_c0_g1~~TRINITY_DN1070_c0_g1_i4.p5  ORF type:complete len:196 (-),score=69.66 TRINITY_DN1070_c0_g1_i4:1725-2312(-)